MGNTLSPYSGVTGLDPYGPYEKNVTDAGTPVPLDNHPCKAVLVWAKSENTGRIKIGTSNTTCKIERVAEDSYSTPCTNSNEVWIDSTVDGEGVWYQIVN